MYDDCPSDSVLHALLEESLPDTQNSALEHHVQSCPKCSAVLERLVHARIAAIAPFLKLENRAVSQDLEPRDPQVITGFVLGNEIGKGGIGGVWQAFDEDLQRTVAIKVLHWKHRNRPGANQRFVQEARLTGQLQHPGVPPVYRIGETSSALPYFAMELVQGDTLARLLSRRVREDIPGFVQMFAQLCQVVAYAHSQDVIHRDLKPGNIMVGKFGELQLMDWGMAKRIRRDQSSHLLELGSSAESQLGDSATPVSESISNKGTETVCSTIDPPEVELTQPGEVMGTLPYMSPEQARSENHNVDERTDVFALGAILCEILTEAPPYNQMRIDQVRYAAMHADLGDAVRRLETCAADKQLCALARSCLSPDPSDRPKNAGLVAKAVSDYLTWTNEQRRLLDLQNRTAKLRQKNLQRLFAVIVASLAVMLLMGAIYIVQLDSQNTQLVAAVAAERLATARAGQKQTEAEAKRKEAVAAREMEIQSRKQAEEVTQLMVTAFRSPDPALDGSKLTVAESLDRAVDRLNRELKEQPLVKAKLLSAIGESYRGLGLYLKAASVLKQSLKLYREVLGQNHIDAILCLNHLASAYESAGEFKTSLQLFEEALAIARRELGEDSSNTLSIVNNLAEAYHRDGQREKAMELFRLVFEKRRALLEESDPDAIASLYNFATALIESGDAAQALPLFEQALHKLQEIHGQDHPDTCRVASSLAVAYQHSNRLDESRALFEVTLERQRKRLGDTHPDTLLTMSNLGNLYAEIGELEKAVSMHEPALSGRRTELGADHPDTLASLNNLAVAYQRAGHLEKALPLLEECLQRVCVKLGEDHPQSLVLMTNLARAYLLAKEPEKMAKQFSRFVDVQRASIGQDDLRFATLLAVVALDLLRGGAPADAEIYLRECLEIRKQKSPDDWSFFNTQCMLARALVAQSAALIQVDSAAALRKLAEAEPLLLVGYSGMKLREANIPKAARSRLVEALQSLVDLYNLQNKPEEVIKWKAELELETKKAP